MKAQKREADVFYFVLYGQKTHKADMNNFSASLCHRNIHSQTTLIQVFPVTLLVLLHCLRPAQPENVSSICIIMPPFLWSSQFTPVPTRQPETERQHLRQGH